MQELELKVKRRPIGKQESKKVRRSGLVTGIYYRHGEECLPIAADPKALRPLVYTSKTHVVSLEVEGVSGKKECILKDVTFDPVTDMIKHFDLIGIDKSHKMSVEIPVVLKGQSIGVRLGGLLQHNVRKVMVHCLPQYIPESIDIDISDLQIGKSISLKDIKFENVEFSVPIETIIVSVTASRVTPKL